jgi:hypothetical protein
MGTWPFLILGHFSYIVFVAEISFASQFFFLSPCYLRDGQNNGNTRQCRNKTHQVGCTERTLVVSIFHYSFFCLHCVVPVSNALQIVFSMSSYESTTQWRLVRFSKRPHCWYMFNWSICNQTSHFIRGIHSSSCQGYNGTSSAKTNSGQKLSLSKRNCHTLKRIDCKSNRTTAATVTAKLNIHPFILKTLFPQKQSD